MKPAIQPAAPIAHTTHQQRHAKLLTARMARRGNTHQLVINPINPQAGKVRLWF